MFPKTWQTWEGVAALEEKGSAIHWLIGNTLSDSNRSSINTKAYRSGEKEREAERGRAQRISSAPAGVCRLLVSAFMLNYNNGVQNIVCTTQPHVQIRLIFGLLLKGVCTTVCWPEVISAQTMWLGGVNGMQALLNRQWEIPVLSRIRCVLLLVWRSSLL